ncbi:phosphatase PAP2 family protein [Pedococcus bigeumensis]|nr:phosphatase PAP2 family protein [Pedococcus bigeumensis]
MTGGSIDEAVPSAAPSRMRRPHHRTGWLWMMLGLLGLAGAYVGLVLMSGGRDLDSAITVAMMPRSNSALQASRTFMRMASPEVLVPASLAVLIYGLFRNRHGVRVVGAACAGLLFSAYALKVGLPRPGGDLSNSFPSGHVSAAVALTLVVAGVLRRSARLVGTVVAASITAAVAVATVALQWHRPSDALGAITLGALWWGVVVLVIPKGNDFSRAR